MYEVKEWLVSSDPDPATTPVNSPNMPAGKLVAVGAQPELVRYMV